MRWLLRWTNAAERCTAAIGILMVMAASGPASADVTPSGWFNLIVFSMLEVNGATPRTGTLTVRQHAVPFSTPYGFPYEGIADVTAICTPSAGQSGGHAEAWVLDSFFDPAFNDFLRSYGFLQHDSRQTVEFQYGASLSNGSGGSVFPCSSGVSNEGYLVLSIYVQQTFDASRSQWLNGELLYCSLSTTFAADSNIERCDSYYLFSSVALN